MARINFSTENEKQSGFALNISDNDSTQRHTMLYRKKTKISLEHPILTELHEMLVSGIVKQLFYAPSLKGPGGI